MLNWSKDAGHYAEAVLVAEVQKGPLKNRQSSLYLAWRNKPSILVTRSNQTVQNGAFAESDPAFAESDPAFAESDPSAAPSGTLTLCQKHLDRL